MRGTRILGLLVLLAALLAVVGIGVRRANQPVLDRKLVAAVENNDLPAVLDLLRRGADPNSRDRHRRPALRLASHAGDDDIFFRVLEAGADPNLPGEEGLSTLLAVAAEGPLHHLEAILEAGGDPLLGDHIDRSPLMFALEGIAREGPEPGYEERFRLLLAAGADPNQVTMNRETVLMVAVHHAPHLVETLLQAGADPTGRAGYDRTTAREQALEHGHTEIAALLEEAEAAWRDRK